MKNKNKTFFDKKPTKIFFLITGIILGMISANEKWYYNVMLPFIDCAHNHNDLWFTIFSFVAMVNV